MEVLLDLQRTYPKYHRDETIRNLMLILLQVGSDTSAVTLERAFSHLLDNPEILKTDKLKLTIRLDKTALVMNPIWLNFLTSDASSMRHCGSIQQPLYLCLTFHQKTARLQAIEFGMEQF